MKKWLVYNGKVYTEEQLRSVGWGDKHLRAPHACRVREILFDDIIHGKTIKELIEGGQLVDYDSNVHRVSNTTKRDELIDDIEALCLSIEKRQNELSRLVKELKG